MRIILAHNFYGSSAPSGENIVYEAEKSLLKAAGHEVYEYTRYSDQIRVQGAWGMLKAAFCTPWNPFACAGVKHTLQREEVSVIHVHNTFPLISPAIFHSTRGSATATVLTLHNYRTVCAAAIPVRDGETCIDCIDKRSVIPAVLNGCYRNSRLATLPLAASIALHRKLGTWENHVDAFIVLTEFQRDLMISAGLPANRIHIKPHFYPGPPTPILWKNRLEKITYVGRLREEKGIRFLIEAWERWGKNAPILQIIGDGPDREILESQVVKMGLSRKVSFLGQLSFKETQAKISTSKLLVLPSICFEGFPMVIREAFALGVPVAASNLGAMATLVAPGKTGALFKAGDPNDLYRVVAAAWQKQDELATMARYARNEFELKYTANANYQILTDIYRKAIENKKKKVLR